MKDTNKRSNQSSELERGTIQAMPEWTQNAKQLSTKNMKSKRRADNYPLLTIRIDD